MNKVYFALGLHFHQPVGNFSEILERAYEKCYKPFLEVYSKYPNIKMSLHLSGNLLDYFEKAHPEFLDKVKALIDRGQVEIMGGGYYEPILQAIPQKDRVGQIEMLSRYFENRFGKRPTGLWVPERVWSPEIIPDLAKCNMKYAVLDDAHLIKAGVSEDDLYGYFMTQDKDTKIAIFPSDKALRYIIPFRPPRDTIDYFRDIARKKTAPLFIYGDDAEKFGEWPYTHDWVYKKGWLDSFFKSLTRNQQWIETIRFSDYLSLFQPLKELHVPEASYEEMMEWANGSWMNYLERYPESNQMHKRMTLISERVTGLVNSPHFEANRNKVIEARRELYKGQTNCPYWHGVFGGIYMHHLRGAVYEHLINADRICDEVEETYQNGSVNTRDIDFYNDGNSTVICENKDFFLCIDPASGGVIRELDYKPRSVNFVNTLARRKESYHTKILERINNKVTEPLAIQEAIKKVDPRIKKGIFYDKFKRACLVDHFIDKDLEKNDFADCNYADDGDFAEGRYNVAEEEGRVLLSRTGKLGDKSIEVMKAVSLSSAKEVGIVYTLKNKSSSRINTCFGTELNIAMPGGETDKFVRSGNAFSVKDAQGALELDFIFSKKPDKFWHFPVHTVSQSERAYSLSYQSLCIFPIWNIKLGAGEEFEFSIRLIVV
ncbi:MAG: DUF1926 domain-containing protein [Candidatus Gorgyraea atricola]|nr:DUF1926 domain-containing protein [Candidatus Gorgyraea atricola]